MIRKFFFVFLASSMIFTGCKNNNDDAISELTLEDQDRVDDDAIADYLKDHYFDPTNGKIKSLNELSIDEKSKYQSLQELVKKVESKDIWYVENPYNNVTEGSSIKSSEESKILISYEIKGFKATSSGFGTKYSNYVNNYSSSINIGDGSAKYDPSFYYSPLTQSQKDKGIKKENVELVNFSEALKYFKSTNRSPNDLYNFQGVIILPSRSAFGRNRVYESASLQEYNVHRDISYIINFELISVTNR